MSERVTDERLARATRMGEMAEESFFTRWERIIKDMPIKTMTPYTPSEAEIEAALIAWYGGWDRGNPDEASDMEDMRRALIAAASARNEAKEE